MTTRAETFAKLHQGPDLLVLPNAWDAMSARVIEHAGAKAIATSSAAVAWAQGTTDGQVLAPELLIATIRAIARVVSIPVSADIEMGYAQDAAAAGAFAARVIDAGAVGVNIEDGSAPPDILCAKIEALREAGAKKDVALWVNARTDVYLKNLKSGEAAFEEAVARAKRYAEQGADSIFVPAVSEPAIIGRLVKAIELPLNVLGRGVPDAATLKILGVRRLSAGGGVARACFSHVEELAKEFLKTGRSEIFYSGPLASTDLNALMRQ
jgi:2-methylisocitrate lyase-like PEP mutase family enzyme